MFLKDVQTTATQSTLDSLAAHKRTEAAAAHAQYPQYDGHWNGWRIAEITRRVRTKLGVAFEPGDLVLVSPTVRTEKVPPARGLVPYADWPEKRFATAYSWRNGVDTGVFVEDVREIRVVESVALLPA